MTEQHQHNIHNKSHPGGPKPLGILMCLGALAGVLIWAKLRLVTDIPRSAYADPREQYQPEPCDGQSACDADISDAQSQASDSGESKRHETHP